MLRIFWELEREGREMVFYFVEMVEFFIAAYAYNLS